MEYRTGPTIEEIVDIPPVLRNITHYENTSARIDGKTEIKNLMSQPDFPRNRHKIRRVIDILIEMRNEEIKKEQHYGFSTECARKIKEYQSRIESYTKRLERAEMEAERKEETRIEEARRRNTLDYDISTQSDSRFYNSQSGATLLREQERRKSRQDSSREYENEEEKEDRYYRNVNRSESRHERHNSSEFPKKRSRVEYESNEDTRISHRSAHHNSQRQIPRLKLGKRVVTKTSHRRFKPGAKALSEIRKYQKSTDLLIQKAPFRRIVIEILREMHGCEDFRIRSEALEALQEASEAFLVEMFESSALLSTHAKRVTLMPSDIQLYKRLVLRDFY